MRSTVLELILSQFLEVYNLQLQPRGKYVNMKTNNLKFFTSRKALHRLSSRQRSRIRLGIKQNFCRYKKLDNIQDIQDNMQDIPGPSTSTECNRSNNFIDT